MADLVTAVDLAELQAVHAGLLVDRCVVTDPATEVRELDPDTDLYVVTTPAVVVYAGPCALEDPSQGATQDVAGGGREWATSQRMVKLPVLAPSGASGDPARVAEGHMVRITATGHDPGNLGRVLRVDGAEAKSWPAVRRLRCREMTG